MELIQIQELQSLPDILSQNQGLSSRAISAMSQFVLPACQDLEVLAGDAIEAQVMELRKKANDSIKINKERRMPFTKRMDEVKSLFTKAENDIEAELNRLVTWCNAWAAEKHKRSEQERAENAKKLQKENAKVDFAAAVKTAMEQRLFEMCQSNFSYYVSCFYSCKDEAEMNDLLNKMSTPPSTNFGLAINISAHPLLDNDEMGEIYNVTYSETLPALEVKYNELLNAEIERIQALIPGRLADLSSQSGQDSQQLLEQEQNRVAETMAAEQATSLQQIEETQNTEKLSNSFEQAAIAPAVEATKGTTHKKKYEPQSHQQIIPIIQWFVTNQMGLMTVEDALKKFSFMITAANKDLNKGTVIEGVPVVDDFTTRTSKK